MKSIREDTTSTCVPTQTNSPPSHTHTRAHIVPLAFVLSEIRSHVSQPVLGMTFNSWLPHFYPQFVLIGLHTMFSLGGARDWTQGFHGYEASTLPIELYPSPLLLLLNIFLIWSQKFFSRNYTPVLFVLWLMEEILLFIVFSSPHSQVLI